MCLNPDAMHVIRFDLWKRRTSTKLADNSKRALALIVIHVVQHEDAAFVLYHMH